MSRYKAAYDTEPAPEPQHASTHPDCPGKCNAAYRAAEKRREDKGTDHDLEPHPGQPVWCGTCTTALRGALGDWPDLATRLQEEIDAGISCAQSEEAFVSGSKSRPVHEHEAESFLLDEYAEWIGSWADTIRAQRDLPPRTSTDLHQHPLHVIADATAFLLPHLTWHLAGRPADEWEIAREFGLELLGYHRRAQTLTSAGIDVRPRRCDGVPCPMCDGFCLEWEVETAGAQGRVNTFAYDEHGQVRREPVELLRVEKLPRGGKRELWLRVPVVESKTAVLDGAETGYVRCRTCRPVFRMTPEQYERYTRLWAAHARQSGWVTPQILAEVFGGSTPARVAA